MEREGTFAMASKIEIPRMPKDPKPRRPSYDNVARNIGEWANSCGLQKPGNRLDRDDRASRLQWSALSACEHRGE
jgi:hypothetical protein